MYLYILIIVDSTHKDRIKAYNKAYDLIFNKDSINTNENNNGGENGENDDFFIMDEDVNEKSNKKENNEDNNEKNISAEKNNNKKSKKDNVKFKSTIYQIKKKKEPIHHFFNE